MSKFIPGIEHLREVLIHYFIMKKTPAESYRILCEAYGEHKPTQDACERWFERFRNGDFRVKGRSSKFKHQQLQVLLNEDAL